MNILFYRVRITLLLFITGFFFSCNTVQDEPVEEPSLTLNDLCAVVNGQKYYVVDTLGNNFFIVVPESADLTHLVCYFNDQKLTVRVEGTVQISGETANDFSNINEGVCYTVSSLNEGDSKNYIVRVLNTQLPVLLVNTEKQETIEDKVNWKNARIRIVDGVNKEIICKRPNLGPGLIWLR